MWAIYIFPRLVFLFCWRKYVDRSCDYINRSKTHECWNWGWSRAIPRKGIHKGGFRCSVGTGKPLTFFYSAWPKVASRRVSLIIASEESLPVLLRRRHEFITHQIPDEIHAFPLVEAVEVVSGRDVWKRIYPWKQMLLKYKDMHVLYLVVKVEHVRNSKLFRVLFISALEAYWIIDC